MPLRMPLMKLEPKPIIRPTMAATGPMLSSARQLLGPQQARMVGAKIGRRAGKDEAVAGQALHPHRRHRALERQAEAEQLRRVGFGAERCADRVGEAALDMVLRDHELVELDPREIGPADCRTNSGTRDWRGPRPPAARAPDRSARSRSLSAMPASLCSSS